MEKDVAFSSDRDGDETVTLIGHLRQSLVGAWSRAWTEGVILFVFRGTALYRTICLSNCKRYGLLKFLV